MKTLRKIIEIDEELCDGLGACLGECPTGALKIVEREADEFDEEAVEQYLAEKEEEKQKEPTMLACGCPSTNIETFAPASSCKEANIPGSFQDEESALSHWPVQIRLVPATAPFLKGADLLVLADCCGIAIPTLHRDLLKGRVVMIGCPKFDDVEEYIDKFTDIFKTADINSVMAVVMEVPCCSGLPMIVKKGMEAAGKNIPIEELVISRTGKILK